jgi:alpha-L-fucosidase
VRAIFRTRSAARALLLAVAGAAGWGCGGSSAATVGGDAGADDGSALDEAGADDAAAAADVPLGPPTHLEELQRAHVDLRFGMFIHFGILTYTGMWAQPNLDITQFNPTQLDPNQWADAAVAAHMTYGVLTTRHHDGFALWDSQAGTFDVGSIPWMNGQGDVVRAYVDAFRAHGLAPGLYYSIWDATEGLGNKGVNSTVTAADMAYIETQLTELLTNYGPIPLLVFDGWSWKMGHRLVDYAEIRRLVKSLQPDCLMLDNTHLDSPWENDLVGVEEAEGNSFIPADNTFPATQMQKINASGGNDWFWAPDIGGIMSVAGIVNGHLGVLEPRWTNFLLNCPPNRDGLLDDAIVSRLAEVGAAWSPDATRPPLPRQPPQIERPYDPDPLAATATSGRAPNAVDGVDDFYGYSTWVTTDPLPQSITIDLGQVHPDVSIVDYVPRYVYAMGPSADGAITSYEIATSVDGAAFTTVASGAWPADAKMKTAAFDPTAARYVRLTANAANGTAAVATEIAVGAGP